MSKEKPSYYSIMPASVRYDDRLKPNEKLLYSEITCLSNTHGYCHASNNYFAELYQVKKETVSRWIAKLQKYNYIKSELIYKENTKQVKERRIKISCDLLTKKSIPIDKKVNTPIDKKVKDNNTSNNNTSIKEKSKPKKKFTKPTHEDIKKYLQEKQQQMDIDYFIDYYESKDWMIGKNRMKNWKSAVNNWLRNNKKYEVQNAKQSERKLTYAERTNAKIKELQSRSYPSIE